MKAKIVEGWDSFKGIALYRLIGIDSDFVGEWKINKQECIKEAETEKLIIVER